MFEEFGKSFDTCTHCPRLCQSACPVAMNDANEAHTPWGIMQALNLVKNGELPFDEDVAHLSYQCLTCRACTQVCEHEVPVADILSQVRRRAVANEVAPPEIAGFLAKFHRHNNPFSRDLLNHLQKIVPKKYFDSQRDVTYFASCTTIAKAQEVIRDTFELFDKLKIDFVGVYPETIQCCGYPLNSGGLEEEFVEVAEINFNLLKDYKTIISGSPACVYTLRETYAKYHLGLGDKVLTINEFLEPYFHNIDYKIKKSLRTKLLYHDPCYLARYLKEVERPRELIAHVSGYEPLEFFKHGEDTVCSGQGGCYSIVNQEKSNQIAESRLAEIRDRGVQMLVTQCPSCIHKFKKNSKGLIVKDLVSYLNDCIEGVKVS